MPSLQRKKRSFWKFHTLIHLHNFHLFYIAENLMDEPVFTRDKSRAIKYFRPANDFASLKYPSIYYSLILDLDTDRMLKMARIQFCIESDHLNHWKLKPHQVPFQRHTRHSCTFRTLVCRRTTCFIRLIETHQIGHGICAIGFGGILKLNQCWTKYMITWTFRRFGETIGLFIGH